MEKGEDDKEGRKRIGEEKGEIGRSERTRNRGKN